MQKRKVIIDTDPGLDDARCILLIMAQPDIEVVALTTMYGNGTNIQSARNAGMLLSALNCRSIPVFQQGNTNSVGQPHEFIPSYHGPDAFGGICFEIEPVPVNSSMTSHQALNHYTTKFPNEITLLALGPLTNLALAYEEDKEFPSRLKGLFLMGGNVEAKTVNNMSDHSEFNSYIDPPAGQTVFEHFGMPGNQKIHVIEWSFCLRYQIPSNFYYEVGETLRNKNVGKILMAKPPSIKHYTKDQKCPIADEFVSYIFCVEDAILKSTTLKIDEVVIEGEKKGQTRFLKASDGNVLCVDEICQDKFLNFIKSSITDSNLSRCAAEELSS